MSKSSQRQSEALYRALISEERFYPFFPRSEISFFYLGFSQFRVRISLSSGFLIGFATTFYLGFDKLYLNTDGRLIAQRPEFFIALTTMLLGTQFFVAGFLGELWMGQQNNTQRYTIKKRLKK